MIISFAFFEGKDVPLEALELRFEILSSYNMTLKPVSPPKNVMS
jgi:hypothetical protein